MGENEAKGLVTLNVEAARKCISLNILANLGGKVTDNEATAALERKITFSKVMESLRTTEYNSTAMPETIQGDKVFGVTRMIVDGGDLYHIENIAMSHCMNAAFREMERGNHRQLHPLQLLQSIHDLIKINKTVYQYLFNEVLDNLGLPPEMIRLMQETQQR